MANSWSLDGWYLGQGESLAGPVTTGELKQLVAGGRLRLTDTVWLGWKGRHDRLLLPAEVRFALQASRAA
jgi:hypothetical protein